MLITIRDAQLNDCEQLEHIIKTTFHLSCPPESDRELQKDYINENLTAEHFKQMVNDEFCQIWVAVSDNNVVGLSIIYTNSKEVVEFSKFYVLPDYHGKGVADALHKSLFDFAESNKYKKIRLYVYSKNMRAKTFYEKSGFVLVADYKYHMMTEVYDDHVYELFLVND